MDFKYSIYGTTLELVTKTKYLGVTFMKDLPWGRIADQWEMLHVLASDCYRETLELNL